MADRYDGIEVVDSLLYLASTTNTSFEDLGRHDGVGDLGQRAREQETLGQTGNAYAAHLGAGGSITCPNPQASRRSQG